MFSRFSFAHCEIHFHGLRERHENPFGIRVEAKEKGRIIQFHFARDSRKMLNKQSMVRRARARVRKIDLKSEHDQRARRAADASDSVPVKFGARNKRPFPLPGEVFL